MQLHPNGLPFGFPPSFLRFGAPRTDALSRTTVSMPLVVCWHHAPGANGDSDTGGAAGATPGMGGGNTGLDPIQGNPDFYSGGNTDDHGDTGGTGVNAQNSGATGESNTATGGNAAAGEEA